MTTSQTTTQRRRTGKVVQQPATAADDRLPVAATTQEGGSAAESVVAADPRPVLVTEPGIYLDIPEGRYHRDDALAPELGRSLSASGAKTLIGKTPAHFAWEREHGRPDKKAFDIGHAGHRFILGKGNDIARIASSTLGKDGSASTAAAKAFIAEARAAYLVPLKTDEYLGALEMAKAVKRHPTFGQLFHEGDAEVSLYWTDEATGVTCRARADWLHPRACVDVKTCDDGSPAGFARAAANFRYDISAAAYTEALLALTGQVLPFVFVTVEKAAPYYPAAYVLPDDALEQGRRDWHRALEIYAECESSGQWPTYSDEIQTLPMPAWYFRQSA